MDCLKPQSDPSKPHKFTFPFSNCIHPQTPTSRFNKNNKPQDFNRQKSNDQNASKEALLAKLFASVSSIKASYAELQSAQFPYDATAVQSADRQVVAELVVLSDLKHKFVTRTLDLPPPHVANLLAEIQEQQSNIKTYEISIKQMESKIRTQDAQISSMAKHLRRTLQVNKSTERRLNASASGSLMGNLSLADLNHTHFIRSLQMVMKSVRNFVKRLVHEMESKGWQLDLAAKAAVYCCNNNIRFTNPKHKAFAFESYLCRVLFDGFNHRDFLLDSTRSRDSFFNEFKRLQCETASQILIENPESEFARFCRSKYLKLVHPKMECSFFENLDQRKLIMSSVAFPGSDFFSAFAEAAKMIWLIHSLAFSFDPPVVAFQVKRGCRFSEVYMESIDSGRSSDALLGYIGHQEEVSVAFTVVPGFKIGKMVVQSQVYLSSAPP